VGDGRFIVRGDRKNGEKINYFLDKQKKIIHLNQELDKKKSILQKEYEEKILIESKDLMKEVETYRAEMKAWIGITDGERSDVLQLVQMFMTLKKHPMLSASISSGMDTKTYSDEWEKKS